MEKLTVCASLVALLFILDQVKESTCQCSTFTYTQHPPVPLNCRPFSNDATPTWQLVTRCAAERDTTDTAPFDVQWFQRDFNGVIQDFPTLIGTFNSQFQRAEKTFGLNLRGMPFDESMLGQYWCQVYLNGSPVPAYSDSFTILRPEEYDNQLPVCNTRQDLNTDICFDTPPPAPVPSSTQTPPSLIPSTTISSITSLIEQTTTSAIPIITAIPISTSSTIPPTTTPMATISTTNNIPAAVTTTVSLASSTTTTDGLTETTLLPTIVQPSMPHETVTIDPTTTPIQSITRPTSASSVLPTTTEQLMIQASTDTQSVIIATSSIQHSSISITDHNHTPLVTTTSILLYDDAGMTNLPEERAGREGMSYLLITAIALIVILSVLIILLLIIAYLMIHKKKRTIVRREIRRKQNDVLYNTTDRRTSEAELLNENNEEETSFKTINYAPITHQSLVTNGNGPARQGMPHSYSIISDKTLPSTSPVASSPPTTPKTGATSGINNGGVGRSFNGLQLRPPAILKSKSPSLNGSSLSQSLLHPMSSSTVYPLNNTSFQYTKLKEPPTDMIENLMYSRSVSQLSQSIEEDENGYSICKTSLQEDQHVYQKPFKQQSDLKPDTTRAAPGNNGRAKKMSDVSELQNWENQLQANPMYMKLPVGLRVVNTL